MTDQFYGACSLVPSMRMLVKLKCVSRDGAIPCVSVRPVFEYDEAALIKFRHEWLPTRSAS